MLLQQINKSINVRDVDLVSSEMRRRLLHEFNDTIGPSHCSETLAGAIERRVSVSPDVLAVETTAGTSLSFAALNRRANQMARVLLAQGVERGSMVGITFNSCSDLIVAMVALLKVGAAYVPVHPDFPRARKTAILEDCAARFCICNEETSATVASCGVSIVLVDSATFAGGWEEHNLTAEEASPDPHDLAYVLYTSGQSKQIECTRMFDIKPNAE